MPGKRSDSYIDRKNPERRYNPSSKFNRRLRSHDRPVKPSESMLPPDNPGDQFTTIERP